MSDDAIIETPVRYPLAPSPSAIFINLRHRAYLMGRNSTLEIATTSTVFAKAIAVGVITILLGALLFTVLPPLAPILMVIGLLVAMAVPFAFVQSENQRINAKATQDGTFIEGEIVSCVAHVERGGAFIVTMTYSFVTPTEQRLSGTHAQPRSDLIGKQLPLPGTPVYVLYFDNKEFYLL